MGERVFLVVRFVVVVVLAVVVTVLALPSPITSEAWNPPRAPNLEGGFAPNGELALAERLLHGQVVGPESVAIDALGRVYSGTTDGKIVRVQPGGPVEVFAVTNGRPLGMRFGPTGHLWVADAGRGLLRVDPQGNVEEMLREVEGTRMLFVDDVVVTAKNVVYFTDASKWGYGEQTFDILEAIPSGRVVRFEPETNKATVIARGLAFANGIALAPDESYLLVAESARYRIARIWLQGDRTHLIETFVDNLPGFPDNVTLSPRGTWWVALFSVRKPLLDLAHPFPFVKDTLAGLPEAVRPRHRPYGLVFEMTMGGIVLRSFHDASGRTFRDVTSALEHGGDLYVGTLTGTAIGRLPLPPATSL